MKNLVMCLLFGLPLLLGTNSWALETEHVFGFGLGLPYGGIGVNYEAGLSDWFAPTGGIGNLNGNFNWNLGGRLYYPGRAARLRGRLTMLYGTNATLNNSSTGEKTALEGFSAGFGLDWRHYKNWAIGFDVFIADPVEPAGATRESGNIVLALGFSRRW